MQKKKLTAINKAKRLIKGITLEWEDKNPLEIGNVKTPKIGHRNPVNRLIARDIIVGFSDFILNQFSQKWKVTITLFFKYPNRDKYEEEITLNAHCPLNSLTETFMKEIKHEMRRHHENAFYNCTVHVECVG